MLSLSDNEFTVLNFLVRNFYERLTIRNIAKRLKFSPAGVYNTLKKLEKLNVVYGEKLGTGLFYKINLESKLAYYLAATVLVGYFDIDTKVLEKHKIHTKCLLYDKKTALFIVDDSSFKTDFSIESVDVIVKTEEEFIESIRHRDPEVLQLLKNSTTVFGEDFILSIIKIFTERF